MARIAYTGTDDSGMTIGGMFESDTAEKFDGNESNYADEHDYSLPEELYLTDSGSWILNQAVVASPDRSTYTRLSADEARAWLEANNHPEAVTRYFERPKGGRPKIGERVITTIPARLHNEIVDLSEMYAEDFPETLRRLLGEAIEHRRIIGAPGSRQEQ
jgi:hypothetical protein